MPIAAPEKEIIGGFQVEAGTKYRLEQLRRKDGERSIADVIRKAVFDLLDERGL